MKFDELKQFLTTSLEDLKAADIVTIDVRNKTSLTDMMVICTGNSSRHVKSLAKNLADTAKAAGIRPLGMDGESEGEWILLDLGDAMVHILQFNTRQLYQLEELWDASTKARKNEK